MGDFCVCWQNEQFIKKIEGCIKEAGRRAWSISRLWANGLNILMISDTRRVLSMADTHRMAQILAIDMIITDEFDKKQVFDASAWPRQQWV